MHILYDHQVFSFQKYGGISRYFYELIKYVSTFECVDLYQGFHINRYGLDKEKTFNMKFAYCMEHTGSMYKWLNTKGVKYFSAKSKADIYHPTYYNDFYIPKKKLVVTVFDMIHELFPQYFTSSNDVETINNKRKILERADRILSISESTKEDVINMFDISPDKIDVVYLANSLKLNVMEKRIISEPYCLFVGNRGTYKNFLPMLKAFAMSEYRRDLKIVAFGAGEFNDEERELIKALDLEGRVEQISGDDQLLANLYNYAEVFVYPSLYEGFGLPPLEAMYYGTPVVCSNTSSLPEVVADAAIQFNPHEMESMTDVFNRILSDGALRETLSVKGKKREKEFSWVRCAKETIDTYHKVMGE